MPPEDARRAEGDSFLYFAYGSNLDIDRLHENCPSARLVATARLDGYRLAFTRYSTAPRWGGSGVADILPSDGGVVWGAVWEIEARHSAALDRQEGVNADPPAYQRTEVEVRSPRGDLLLCRTYRVVSPGTDGFAPSDAYRETLLRGARAVGLSDGYVSYLETITLPRE